jgi:5-methylcytosine-specific restriction endonuclease McrA
MGKRRKKKSPYNKREFYRKNKRSYRNSRDYKSPEYSKWRKDIKERDNYTCQMPGCLSRTQIQVHHIKTWANYPGLRFVTANGITLCRKCHDSIKGKEADYESFFLKILEWQMLEKIKKYNKRKK